MKQTTGNDSGGSPVTLEPVVIIGRPLLPRLLSISGEYYYHNVGFWRDAMAYARSAKKPDAELAIFMKRVNYQRGEWAKGIFGIIGGAVAAVLTVEAFVVASAGISAGLVSSSTTSARFMSIGKSLIKTNFRSISTYYNMAINAGVQTAYNNGEWRDINVVSVFAEGLSPGLGALTNGVEIRPFTKRGADRRFRSVFHNKSVSETIFDASVHFGTGYVRGGISNVVRKDIKDPLVKSLKTHFASPVFQTGYQFILQGPTPNIKKTLGIIETENHEEVEQ